MEEFKKELRKLVEYTLSPEDRKDKDVVETYYKAFLSAFEEYKNLK